MFNSALASVMETNKGLEKLFC